MFQSIDALGEHAFGRMEAPLQHSRGKSKEALNRRVSGRRQRCAFARAACLLPRPMKDKYARLD
jgi:hypothetical protein